MNTNQLNTVVNVTLTGGLIGLFGKSPQRILDSEVKKFNRSGYRVIQIIPAHSGSILLLIFRIFLLIITIFFYTTATGYYLILEKTVSIEDASLNQSEALANTKQQKPNIDDLFN